MNVLDLLRGDVFVSFTMDDYIDTSFTMDIAHVIFMELKQMLLMNKLSGAAWPDHIDGGQLQRHFAPTYRGAPYYWLRGPYVADAIDILKAFDLISHGNKGFINGSGSDELFSLGKFGMDIVQEERTTEAISQRVRKTLIDKAE